MTDRIEESRLEVQMLEELHEAAFRHLTPAMGVDGLHLDTLREVIAQRRAELPVEGEREVLVHLNVTVPADDHRDAGEVGVAIERALEVGFDDESVRDLRVVVAMCDELGPVSDAEAGDALDEAIERQTGFHPADPRGDREDGWTQEQAYDLASADHAVPMSTGVVMLLDSMLSHDMDMVTLLVPDADEEVVKIARATLRAELDEARS